MRFHFDKKAKNQCFLFLFLLLMFVLGRPGKVCAAAGNWVLDNGSWKYRQADGSFAQNGFFVIDSKKYYFDEGGIMKTGWIQVGTRTQTAGRTYKNWYYAEPSGALVAGWRVVDGSWYYFYVSGRMAADAVVDNGQYYVNEDGLYVGGAGVWKKKASGWWYQSADSDCFWNKASGKYVNYPSNDVVLIDGAYYGFDADGYMVSGWHNYGFTSNGQKTDAWYYFAPNGKAVNGWQRISGIWYYFRDGYMLSNTVVEGYYLDGSGACQSSILDGYRGRGNWQNTASGWRYVYNNGTYEHTGKKQIDGVWYYFRADGYMKTGWVQEGATWYYYNADGSAANGWQMIGGTWYYFDETGFMYAGTYVDGYYIDGDGAWIPSGPSYATDM